MVLLPDAANSDFPCSPQIPTLTSTPLLSNATAVVSTSLPRNKACC